MTTTPRGSAGRAPYRVRLPGFVSDQDVGLGDVVTRSTSALGVRPCAGCAQRAAALNRWVVLGRGRSQRGD
jgi:hypothetical protein